MDRGGIRLDAAHGQAPDGVALKVPMPWKTIGRMTDDELHALWLYLQSVPPRAFGNR